MISRLAPWCHKGITISPALQNWARKPLGFGLSQGMHGLLLLPVSLPQARILL
jgi:hypothetical protein